MGLNNGLAERVSQLLLGQTGIELVCRDSVVLMMKDPSKEKLIDLCTSKIPPRDIPMWLEEACFFQEDHTINVHLTNYELTIDYWEPNDIVTGILKAAEKFDDITVKVNKIPSNL